MRDVRIRTSSVFLDGQFHQSPQIHRHDLIFFFALIPSPPFRTLPFFLRPLASGSRIRKFGCVEINVRVPWAATANSSHSGPQRMPRQGAKDRTVWAPFPIPPWPRYYSRPFPSWLSEAWYGYGVRSSVRLTQAHARGLLPLQLPDAGEREIRHCGNDRLKTVCDQERVRGNPLGGSASTVNIKPFTVSAGRRTLWRRPR